MVAHTHLKNELTEEDKCHNLMSWLIPLIHRQALFRSSGIMTHTIGQGEAAFDWRSKVPGSKSVEQCEDRQCAQSLFIEPVRWMAESINQLDGKV